MHLVSGGLIESRVLGQLVLATSSAAAHISHLNTRDECVKHITHGMLCTAFYALHFMHCICHTLPKYDIATLGFAMY
jgi:heme/copper-type cytochrome/quinol oxidase subunit 3